MEEAKRCAPFFIGRALFLEIVYFTSKFFNHSTTSGGWLTTSLARAWRPSPLTGRISQPAFFASARKSGSLTVLLNASRRIAVRWVGRPGVARIGQEPKPPAPR